MLAGLKHFRHCRHDVIVLQVLDRAEVEFPFQQTTMFKGFEDLGDVLTEPQNLRKAYQVEVDAFLKRVRSGCQNQQADYLQVYTDQPLDLVLSGFLATRRKRTG